MINYVVSGRFSFFPRFPTIAFLNSVQ